MRGRILTARVAFGELARPMPTDQDPAELVALPMHGRRPVRLAEIRAMRPDGV